MCVCALSDGLSKDYLDVPSPWADYQVLAFERWLFQLVDGLWQEWVRSHPWSHLLNRWQGVQRQRGRAHHDQTSCTGLSVCVFGFNKKDIFVQERKRSRSRSPTRKPRVRSSRAFRSPSPPRPAQSEFVVDVCAPIVDACASNDFIADCLLFSSPLLC